MKSLNEIFASTFKGTVTKKILLYSVVVILIILPITIASIIIVNTASAENDAVAVSVTLKDSLGNIIASDNSSSAELDDESLAFIANKLNERKTKLSSPPEISKDTVPVILEIDSESEITKLTCYFAIDGKDSYCYDEVNNAYLINELDSTNFLISEYAESLYPSSKMPELITVDKEKILPVSSSWNYKNVKNQFVPTSENKLGEDDSLYEITAQINIAFSTEPDVCQANAYNEDGEHIFDGTLDDLQNIIVNTEESVRVTVDASWKKSDEASYFGTASYDFKVKIQNRSEFSISQDRLEKDGFIVLKATNINDVSKIKFESEHISSKPNFVLAGDNTATAILTYPSSIDEKLNEISFSLSYRASMESFTVNLSGVQTIHTYRANFPRSLSSKMLSAKASTEFMELLNSVGKSNRGEIFSDGSFISPTTLGFSTGISYKSNIIYQKETSPALTTLGSEFISSSYGVSVPALCSGMVVKVGECDYLGKFVVVEHGMGLKSWYCSLSDVDVAEGSMVVSGQSVGKTSHSQISGFEGFWLYVSFEDKLLNPNLITLTK